MAQEEKSEPSAEDTEVDELIKRIGRPFEVREVPQPLFHYTTAFGLNGILTERVFWASAVGFSNDISEGRYATDLGSRIVKNHAISKDPECEELANLVNGIFLGREWEDAFVVSFCAKDDLLSQWRAYGGAASVSLGVNLERDKIASEHGNYVWISEVVYDQGKQEELLKTGLATCVAYFKAKREPGWRSVISVVTYILVTQWACSVKHAAFAEEHEWRITAFPQYKERTQTEALKDALMGRPRELAKLPRIREHRGRLLPYVEVRPKGSLDVASVMVGPTSTKDVDARAINLLRQTLGMEFLVLVSSIPVRM